MLKKLSTPLIMPIKAQLNRSINLSASWVLTTSS